MKSIRTYWMDINTIPRAMPELLQGRAQRWFLMSDEEWPTWKIVQKELRGLFPAKRVL